MGDSIRLTPSLNSAVGKVSSGVSTSVGSLLLPGRDRRGAGADINRAGELTYHAASTGRDQDNVSDHLAVGKSLGYRAGPIDQIPSA